MAIYQGDIVVDDLKVNDIDVFEVYQGTVKVYPSNYFATITFNLNVPGTISISGYTPVISNNNTKFVFTLPAKTNYTANIQADHYNSQVINGTVNYKPITHNVELVWKTEYDTYTVTFPTNGVKVLFDGVEQGTINNGRLIVSIDDRVSKDKYTVSFIGSKNSIYNTNGLTVADTNVGASGGSYDLKLSTSTVKTSYTRTDYRSSTGEISRNSSYAGNWIETIVNLIASFTTTTTLGTINNNVLIIPNNESTSTKSGTYTVTFTIETGGTKNVTANIAQAAGSKVYSDWTLTLTTDGVTVPAAGGTKNVTANIAQRTYKWNNVGTIYTETATPTLSISGSASLNGNQIIFTSNESISARSATITSSYVGLTKTITITQQAGAKVYSAWTSWAVSLSAGVQTLAASGGSTQLTTNASRSRTWTWNGVGIVYTENANGVPSLSGTATGFTLNGTTVSASNNESSNSRSINITATYEGVTKSIIISQSAGSKVYDAWSKWTINKTANGTSIAKTGGNGTISAPSAIRTRSYKWNNVGTTYTEQGNGVPTLVKQSGDGNVTINGTSATISYGNNTSTNTKLTIVRAKIDTDYIDTTFTQAAGAKQYDTWSAWNIIVNSSTNGNIAPSGGNTTITTSANRSRIWTWNGVNGSGGTENENGTPTLSKVSGAGTFANNKVTYDNNTTTNSRDTVIRATITTNTKDITIRQNPGAKTYTSWSAWTILLNANPTTVSAKGGTSNLHVEATRTRQYQWNGVGDSYNESEIGNVTLSKVSGDASLNGTTVTYGNNESTSVKNSVFKAVISNTTKNVTVSQSAGSKVYQNWSPTTFTINITSTTAPPEGSSADLSGTYTRNRHWKWNDVGTDYIETDSGTVTEWSSDTSNTLVISNGKAMAVWRYNNTMQSRTAKFYANRIEEQSTNYVSYTQEPGKLNGVNYNYSDVQVKYNGNILFDNRLQYNNYLKSIPSEGRSRPIIIIPNAAYTTKLYYRIRINIQAWWAGSSSDEESLVNPPFYGFLAETDRAPETGLYFVTSASNADYIKRRVTTRHDIENDCYILDSIYKSDAIYFSANCSMDFVFKGQRPTSPIIGGLFIISLEGNQNRTNVIKADFACKNNVLSIKLNKIIIPSSTRDVYFTNDQDSYNHATVPKDNAIDTFITISNNFPISNYYYYSYLSFVGDNIIDYNHYDKRINETGYGYER